MQALPTNKSPHGTGDQLTNLWPGIYRVRQRNAPPEKEGKINTSQAEPVAANSRAVGQFLSISCEAFI